MPISFILEFGIRRHKLEITWLASCVRFLLLRVQVAGASWYVASIGRQYSCWSNECKKERDAVPPCVPDFLDCTSDTDTYVRDYWRNSTQVLVKCDAINDEDSGFKFGIFANAFTNEVASSTFMEKYLYCLWWGLRNLRFAFLNCKLTFLLPSLYVSFVFSSLVLQFNGVADYNWRLA